ncbi:MAG: hypothetical protein PUA82_00035 [Eubacteriales bacterium]|nr:hypothetical protein [Eubacteriales bacterium]
MDYIDKLEKAIENFEETSGRLSEIPQLTEKIRELIKIYSEGASEQEDSRKKLEELNDNLSSSIDKLSKALELEQKSHDELITEIKTTLIENNKAQVETINSITTIINNKVAAAESSLSLKAVETGNNIKALDLKVSQNRTKLEKTDSDLAAMKSDLNAVKADLIEIKNVNPVIRRTQIIAVIAALCSAASCVIGVLM